MNMAFGIIITSIIITSLLIVFVVTNINKGKEKQNGK